ncbi:hypothetical protein N9W79_01465 [bacterium]|nr:hypothetical protein [bacterium]
MHGLALPKNIASLALIAFSNVLLIAFSGALAGWSLFFAVLNISVISGMASWFFIFDGFQFSGEGEFKASAGVLSSMVLLNGFFSWSQGHLNLNSMLITSAQSIVPYMIIFSGKRVADNLLFDLAAIGLLFSVPTLFDASELWVLKNGTPISALPLLISAMSAVVIFKFKLTDMFYLPLGISKQEFVGALFVVAATISSLVFVKAFSGQTASVEGLNWATIFPFGWVAYVIPALFGEILYRAVLMNWVTKVSGSFSMGLVVSAVLFAVFESGYLMSDNNIALYSGFFLGLFNGIAYHRVGSLTVPVLANVGYISTLVLLGL